MLKEQIDIASEADASDISPRITPGQKVWWLMRYIISDESMHKVEYTAYLTRSYLGLPGKLITAFTTQEELDSWRIEHGWDETLLTVNRFDAQGTPTKRRN